MELKLTVSVGATLQVKNSRGEWDWIKPEVGAEVVLDGNDPQETFGYLWDEVVGPQFKAVVDSLMPETPREENFPLVSDGVDATETVITDEIDEY
jgi:hypothetical protein